MACGNNSFLFVRNSEITPKTEEIIKGLLQLSPERRLTALQVKEKLKILINASVIQNTDGVVPVLVDDEDIQKKASSERPILKAKHSIKVNHMKLISLKLC